MNQTVVSAIPFPQLLADIRSGRVKIPSFQRDFVWTLDRSAKLLDSLLRGYPIGTFIFWKTKERLRSVRNIGGVNLPDAPEGDYVLYVLDGQQRLTSLFAAATGAKVTRQNNRVDDFSTIWANLVPSSDEEEIVSYDPDVENRESHISVTKLLTASMTELVSFPECTHKNLVDYQERLKTYQFSVVTLADAPLDVATEVFTRINVGGVKLSVFEIMVAKTYRAKTKHEDEFDLGQEFGKLTERLANVDFETIPPIVVLYLVAALAEGDCRKKTVLNLDRDRFIEHWHRAVDGIERAVDFFISSFSIPASKLLPYYAMLVLFGFFFAVNKKKPSAAQAKLLRDYFFRAALTGRFTGPTETNLGQDIEHIEAIRHGKHPKYSNDFAINLTADFIETHGEFKTSRAFIKAILCLFCAKLPQSFDDGVPVTVNNAWLKQANSKNYHHFFPKAYLKRIGNKNAWEINHIANITIVDDYLNKAVIRDKAPADYMKGFVSGNPTIDKTMKTHLIANLKTFGVLDNDYEIFFRKRCQAIARELRKCLIPSEFDSRASKNAGSDWLEDEPENGEEAELR